MTAAEIASTMVDATVVKELEPMGSTVPTSERQARELARVPEEQRADVWQATVEATGGKPTAAAIRDTYERTQTPASTPEWQQRLADAVAATVARRERRRQEREQRQAARGIGLAHRHHERLRRVRGRKDRP